MSSSDPGRSPAPSTPEESLSGIRVLDLSGNLAGPYCGQILADLGADVVKVERPGAGDPARAWAPPAWGGDGTLFLAANRGKRSLALELGTQEGRRVLERLLEHTDILIQAFRPDVAERFGLQEGQLRPRFPSLILCTITAFGHEGPDRDRPGYDPLLQAHAGLMSVTGPPGGPPVRMGTSVVDLGAGMWAALGVLSAIRSREKTEGAGAGSHVRVSLLDTAVAWVAYHLMGTEATGVSPGPLGSGLGMIVPYGAFPAADGPLMIAAANDGLFARLTQALELPALHSDPRFATNPSRVAHRIELEAAIAEATRLLPRTELERRLREAGVPCAAVRTMEEVARDPGVRDVAFREEPHPHIPGYRAVAPPPTWDGRRAPPRTPPPGVGGDTEDILKEAGFAPEEIRRLREDGVIG
jgi:crotonobetainyl-CoA:carnitine CoA-transferase CaiB-like acyl-CoA transferase